MLINEDILDKIITEIIKSSFNDVVKDYRRIEGLPNGESSRMPSEDKIQNRYKEYKTCQNIKIDNKFETMANEAFKPKGLMFNKGAVLKRIFNSNKIVYSTEVDDFLRFVKNKYPNKKISKKLIPRKRERNQLDDVEFYNLIINLI